MRFVRDVDKTLKNQAVMKKKKTKTKQNPQGGKTTWGKTKIQKTR